MTWQIDSPSSFDARVRRQWVFDCSPLADSLSSSKSSADTSASQSFPRRRQLLLVRPFGVSTQFVIFDGILWDTVNPEVVVESTESKSGHASPNAYLDNSGGSYARSVVNPVNDSFVFVVALFDGALISGLLRGGIGKIESTLPAVWHDNFGNSAANPNYIINR